MTDLPDAFFVPEAGGFRATELCRGPWDPDSLHGGPVAALVGHVADAFDDDADRFTARVTLELLKPVPLDHLSVDATLVRPGKRVRIIEVSVRHDGVEVTRASVLRVRVVPDDLDDADPLGPTPFASPEGGAPAPRLVEGTTGIMDGMDVRTVPGTRPGRGPSTFWFRMRVPLIAGGPVDPVHNALITADFGNGISSVVPIASHVFINPDLTVYLHRRPRGDWIANDAHTWMHPGAGSLAEGALWDADGQVGRATQSLYVAAR